jgi:hypothetical protein
MEPAMLSVFDSRPGHSRWEFLRIGTLGLGSLPLPELLGARALAAGKSVIFLFQFGGPSRFETFDPKMSAPEGVRSVNSETTTALPGVTFHSRMVGVINPVNGVPTNAALFPQSIDALPAVAASRISLRRR